MGNSPSSSKDTLDDTSLALVAVSHALNITTMQILELRQNCRVGSLGQKRTRPKISRPSLSKAMARSHIVQPTSITILNHLISMWDDDGTERVDYIDYLTGTSVLAACSEYSSVEEVVLFALQVQDVHKTHCITKAKLESLLNGINMTAAYFGDAVLSVPQVQTIARDVFESSQQLHHHVMPHDECARRLYKHALVKDFCQSKGQYTYNVYQHVLEKREPDYIVRLVDQGNIPSTEMGASTCSDQDNEI